MNILGNEGKCNEIETIEPINTDTLKCTLNALGWAVIDFEMTRFLKFGKANLRNGKVRIK